MFLSQPKMLSIKIVNEHITHKPAHNQAAESMGTCRCIGEEHLEHRAPENNRMHHLHRDRVHS